MGWDFDCARAQRPKGLAMNNTYNIYKVKHSKLAQLIEKIAGVGLHQQKTHISNGYSMTFYFSEKVKGNDIWWWDTYKDFFNDDVVKPTNTFHFGMLLSHHIEKPEQIYAVSLGKAHFYLSKLIQYDFGIDLAVRMADENTILLKKSRYFTGTKRQDVSSYQRFQPNGYEPGESVDHLKLRASDRELWGERNIIFADSIQMDMDRNPLDLSEIFDRIEAGLRGEEIIRLPKLEAVADELRDELDELLFTSIKNRQGDVQIDEFQVYGVAICFSFHDYDYRLSAKKSGEAGVHRKHIGNSLTVDKISDFLINHEDIDDINSVSVQFKSDDHGAFTQDLKEILDLPIAYDGYHYFLRNGDWYKFNQTFMNYLKHSLDTIETILMEPLDEADYIHWRDEKQRKIDADEPVDDKLIYRESYFNKKQCAEQGYTLLDRQLTQLQSLERGKKKYRIEVADLFKDREIISVKISETSHELIYNIEQSRDAVELIKRGAIDFDQEFDAAAIWFVFENEIQRITEFNSIQFLLAVESWQKMVRSFGLTPRIYISKHNK